MFAVTLGAGKRIKGWIYVLLKGLNKVGYFCIDKLACGQISDTTHSLQGSLSYLHTIVLMSVLNLPSGKKVKYIND